MHARSVLFCPKLTDSSFCVSVFVNLGQLVVDLNTCAQRAVSSETNSQLQAAKLPNYTNSAATFASYWPITFTCQMNNPNCRNKEELNKDKQALQVDFPSSQFVRICVHAILRILQIWTSANSTNVSKDKTIIMAFLHGLFSDEKVPFLCLQPANFTWHSDSERRLCCSRHFPPHHIW